MALEIVSLSISTKVRNQAEIELVTPWSAVRHVTNFAMEPSTKLVGPLEKTLIFSFYLTIPCKLANLRDLI